MSELCAACHGQGFWDVECCNGAGGCSCGGQPVPMGACNVCHGTGFMDERSDLQANLNAIRGACFIGSGPSGGAFAGAKRLGMPGRAGSQER